MILKAGRLSMFEKLELKVNTEMPEEVYKLMGLYAQTAQRCPPVVYIPVPRSRGEEQRHTPASSRKQEM